jgi:hypothetical protein
MVTLIRAPMAKKAAATESTTKVRDSDGIRQFALTLKEMAKEIEDLADAMDSTGIPRLKVMDGNFKKGLKIISEWKGTQLVSKMVSIGSKKGIDLHVTFGRRN